MNQQSLQERRMDYQNFQIHNEDKEHLLYHCRRVNNLTTSGGEEQAKTAAEFG